MSATLLSTIVKGDKKHLLKQLQANKNFNLNTKIKYSPSKEVEEYDALPLCIATIHANKDIVHILLDHGARADVRDGIDRSPVICAIYGCIDSLKITSENYSLVTKKSPAHEAILAILIRSLPGSSFQDIVNSPQNGSFLKGITPLCLSAYLGKVGICKCLLENGAAVDGVDKNGASPLMYAARDGHVDVVKTLLAFGASIELKDLNGWTASQYGQGYPEILEILEAETLKKNGVTSIFPKNILKNVSSAYPNFYKDFTSFLGNYNLNKKDQDQNTIALLGVSLERTDTLGGAGIEDVNQNLASNQHKLLLAIKYSDVQSVSEYAGDVNFIDEASGLSPLQYATRIRPLVSPSSKKIVKLLVEAGADVNACNIRSGKTPLHYITRDPFNIEATKQEPTPAEKESTQSLIMSIIACLVNSNADPNKADFDGNRPLHYACKSNQQPIVEYLITKADANPLLANKRGKAPIDVCPSDGYLKSFIEFQTRSSNVAILGNLFSEKPRYSRGFDSAYHSSENISRLANSSANENNVKESSYLDNKPLPPTVTTTSQETVRYIEELGAIEDEAANLMSILSNNPGTSTDMDGSIAERLNIMQDDVRNAEATSELLLEDNSKLLRENLELKEKEDEYLSEIERLTKLQAVSEENKLTTVETPSSSTTMETHEETGEQGILTAEIFKAYTKMAESLEQRELEKESLISSLNAERSKRMSAEAELTVSKEVITFLENEVKFLKDNDSNNHRQSINSVSTKYLSMIDGIEGIDRRHSVMPQSSSVPSNPQHPRHSMLNVFDAAGAKQPSAEEMQRAFENLEDDSGFVLLEDLLTQYNPRMSVGDMSRLRQSINLGTSRLDKRNSILSLIDTSAGDVSGEDSGLNVEVLHRLLNAVKSRIYHLNTILTSMKITNNSLEHDLSKTRSELAETNTALDASNSKSERVGADNLQLRADLDEMTKQLESLQGLYDDGCTERKEELESVFKLLQVFIGTPESEIVKTDNLSISSKTAPAPVNTSVQGNGFLQATVKTLEQFDEALLLKHGGSAYKDIKSLLQELSPSLNKKLPTDLPINEIHTTHANYITNIIKSVDAITGNFSVIEKVLASMKEENRKYVKEIIRMRNSALLKGFVNEVRKADKVAASSTTGNEFPSGSNNNRLSRKMSMPLISRNGLDSTFVKEQAESDPPAKPEISTDTMTVKQLLESLQSFQNNNQTISKDIGIEQQSKEHLQALLKTMTDQGLCVDEVKEEFNGTEVQKKRLGIILPDISEDGSDAIAPIVAKKELFKTPWEKVASTFSTMNSNKSNTSSSESAVSTGTRKSSNSSREGSPRLGALFGKIKDAKSKTAMRVKDLKAVFEGKNV